MPKRDWKRENIWLRMLLMGPTGSGKTLAALALAATLFEGKLPIVGIDTEHERMKLYADLLKLDDYRVIEGEYSPETYITELDEVEREFHGGICLIDSATHEWNGKGGVLEIVDKGAGGNWKEGTPRHTKFLERIASMQMHTIVCVRAKMKYDYSQQEVDGRKRLVISKLGIGPEQRDNFPYEFDVVADIDVDTHTAHFSNRCRPLVGKTMNLVPDPDNLRMPNPVAEILTSWLSEGDPPEPPNAASDDDVLELVGLLTDEGKADQIDSVFEKIKIQNRGVLPVEWVAEKIEAAKVRAEARKEPEGATA